MIQSSKLGFLVLVVFCSVCCSSAVREQTIATTDSVPASCQQDEKDTVCPTWFLPVCSNGSLICECKDRWIEGGTVVKCPNANKVSPFHCLTEYDQNRFNVSILVAYCMTYNSETLETLLAICPYNSQSPNFQSFYVTIPSNVSELNDFMCYPSKRQGEFCQSCIKGKAPDLSTMNQDCITKTNSPLIWVSFVIVILLLHVIVLSVVFLCNLQATTGPLNALICICQVISGVIIIQSNILDSRLNIHAEKGVSLEALRAYSIECLGFFYTFWYGHYSWSFNLATEKISTIQVQALEYAFALSPLVLIFLLSLVSRSTLVQRCRNRFNLRRDPLSSLVHTCATYTTLLYTNIMVVSFNLIAPSRVFNQTSELPYKIIPYDASIHFLSHQHIPYVVVALSMLTIFCVLPLLLLILYPSESFQKLLDMRLLRRVNWLPLRIFADSFMGCYRDKTGPERCERRYFAGLYFLFRIIFFLCFFFMKYSYVWLCLILLPLITSFIFLVAQPYKKRWLNVTDSAFFLLLGVLTLLTAYHIYIFSVPEWMFLAIFLLPPLYIASLVIYHVSIKVSRCCRRLRCRGRDGDDVMRPQLEAAAGEEYNEQLHKRSCERYMKSHYSEVSPLLVNQN